MGSSLKKKNAKKKDFQKPKLKVGKARPKPTNFTDTSFNSKSIVLKQQSLHITAPSSSSQFLHHVSLLTSRTDSQRKDALSYLTSSITSRPAKTPLEQPVSLLLPKLLPLILDANNDVRTQLVKLLGSLPSDEIGPHIEKVLPYIRAGMTHLAAAIRSTSLDVLSWALDAAGQDLVTAPGGWLKMLKTFLLMLNWSTDAESSTTGWSSGSRSFRGSGIEDKVFIHSLQTLSSFLHVGLVSSFDEKEEDYGAAMARNWPLRHVEQHQLPKRPNVFGYLNLFGSAHVEGSEAYEDRADRQAEFRVRFQKAIEKGVKDLKKEGGEVGRAAAKVDKALIGGMSDFEDPEWALQSLLASKAKRIKHNMGAQHT